MLEWNKNDNLCVNEYELHRSVSNNYKKEKTLNQCKTTHSLKNEHMQLEFHETFSGNPQKNFKLNEIYQLVNLTDRSAHTRYIESIQLRQISCMYGKSRWIDRIIERSDITTSGLWSTYRCSC